MTINLWLLLEFGSVWYNQRDCFSVLMTVIARPGFLKKIQAKMNIFHENPLREWADINYGRVFMRPFFSFLCRTFYNRQWERESDRVEMSRFWGKLKRRFNSPTGQLLLPGGQLNKWVMAMKKAENIPPPYQRWIDSFHQQSIHMKLYCIFRFKC